MLQAHQRLLDRGVKAFDLVIIGAAIWWGALVRGGLETGTTILQQAAIVGLAWVLVSTQTNFYQSRRSSGLGKEFLHLLKSWFVALGLGSLVIVVIWGGLAYQALFSFGAALVGIGVTRLFIRLALRRLRRQGKNTRRVILLGRGRMAQRVADTMNQRPEQGLQIVGSFRLQGEKGAPPEGVECLGDSARFAKVIHDLEVDSVVLCPDLRVSQVHIQDILVKCDVAGIPCFYAPDFEQLNNLSATSTSIDGMPAFTLQPSLGSSRQLVLKRGMDVVGSAIGIILALPALAAISIAIKLSDGGPLLFRQVRIGKDGRRFYCYKFRSMCVDAEDQKASLIGLNEQDGPVFKIASDPRVTKVGRLMRKYSLDELPQLFNVLLGDMSLVGPRPPVPSEVARYQWWQRRRVSVRPGITCLWQVKGRNRVSFEQWVEMDLFYIDNWSLWMDIKLMAQTMPVVVRGTGS